MNVWLTHEPHSYLSVHAYYQRVLPEHVPIMIYELYRHSKC